VTTERCIEVECYAGSRYPERPQALHWAGERLPVAEVERQWHTPDALVFWVRTLDGRRFQLTYCEPQCVWGVEPLAVAHGG